MLKSIDSAYLIDRSRYFRRSYLELVYNSHEALIPSVFSIIDIITYLYHQALILHSSQYDLFISKGHAASVIYPYLIDLGLFNTSEIDFAAEGSKFGIYANTDIPQIPMPSGSLGHGLGVAAGYTYAKKIHSPIFVFLGDGEVFEGSVYEAALFVSLKSLSNIYLIIDCNNRTIMGDLDQTYPGYHPSLLFNSLGYRSFNIDGHDFSSMHKVFTEAITASTDRPTVIYANTVKGKGFPLLESSHLWHNRMPSKDQLDNAIKELS